MLPLNRASFMPDLKPAGKPTVKLSSISVAESLVIARPATPSKIAEFRKSRYNAIPETSHTRFGVSTKRTIDNCNTLLHPAELSDISQYFLDKKESVYASRHEVCAYYNVGKLTKCGRNRWEGPLREAIDYQKKFANQIIDSDCPQAKTRIWKVSYFQNRALCYTEKVICRHYNAIKTISAKVRELLFDSIHIDVLRKYMECHNYRSWDLSLWRSSSSQHRYSI